MRDSAEKSLIIDDIINAKEERDHLQKKLIDDNPSNQFHRGHVQYKLPVSITTDTNQQTILWYRQSDVRQCTSLKFRVVEKYTIPYIGKEVQDRLNSTWCPIKHIVKLQIGVPILEHFIKQNSAHLNHILSTVEKLHIGYESKFKHIKETCIKTLVTITPNLRSLIFRGVTLESAHLTAICSIKSLRKVEISHTLNILPGFLTVLCSGLPLLEIIKSTDFKISDVPKPYRSKIKKLARVYMEETDETLEFPNLQQCLVTLGDLEYHHQPDHCIFINKLKSIVLPATLSRIIIRSDNLPNANNYLIDIGFQYIKDAIHSKKFNKEIKNQQIYYTINSFDKYLRDSHKST
ncbi:hypothetical protein PPL_03427 [Heterostelium album PN500]|uniref:Uncharacterized protein n=1 Tax=Heterostelium pallidum (strain ATCC 26659 / Pp 5 / PN500) TaxID=670386 RepID=D3B4V1_HETP5|nr:hypothetical protein PPL_03427 [Heterostelium album PN500]EFA84349.1 hypothetical protein PPL_03427 [Heterostelium album PN500]|eukprot:XP_020436464.1 hypothetical protein PPL_03427 [Heterostelium album PN500]